MSWVHTEWVVQAGTVVVDYTDRQVDRHRQGKVVVVVVSVAQATPPNYQPMSQIRKGECGKSQQQNSRRRPGRHVGAFFFFTSSFFFLLSFFSQPHETKVRLPKTETESQGGIIHTYIGTYIKRH